MKIFIYKLIISLFAVYVLFEFTIGSRIDYFKDSINSLKDNDQRILIKEKIKINNELVKRLKGKNFYTYGVNSKSNFLIKNIKRSMKFSEFDLQVNLPNKKRAIIKKIRIPLLGIHNIRNSVAAAAVALTVGISISDIKKRLSNFTGVQRRFNKIFTYNEIDFYDDYAHHPTEIEAVLKGVREVYPKRRIISIFQPHRYSRIKLLKKEFPDWNFVIYGTNDYISHDRFDIRIYKNELKNKTII